MTIFECIHLCPDAPAKSFGVYFFKDYKFRISLTTNLNIYKDSGRT